MNAPVVLAATVAGGGLGWLSGRLSTLLERREGLEAEEAAEREEYERDAAALAVTAAAGGDPPPLPDRWHQDRYGSTWLERVLSPLLGAAVFAIFAAHEGPGTSLYIHLLWMAVFVHIVVFDLKHRLILNRVTYPSVVLALGMAQVTPGLTVIHALTGAVSVALFFLTQSLLSRGRIGLGDAKLGALVGAVTGLGLDGSNSRALYAVAYAVFLGGGVAIALLATRLRGLKDPIPYGPFLCAGAALILYQSPS